MPDNSEDIPRDFVIVLDSTGIKLTNRGEWLGKKYGKKKETLDKAKTEGFKVKEVIADTGIDSHEIFWHLAKRGIKPVDRGQKKSSDNRQQGKG